ncbi:MAG: hypothetical protein DDT25_00839 [Chloroflexi bacterium]|nr:hypothetical protein [Chloroflexota bacterium]
MPYCSDCGSKIESSESFCANCGQQQQPEVSVTPGRKPRKVWLVAGLAVVLLVILGAVILIPGEVGIYGTYVLQDHPEEAVLEIRRDGTVVVREEGRVVDSGQWIWVIKGEVIKVEARGKPAVHGRIEGNKLIFTDPWRGEIIFVRQ